MSLNTDKLNGVDMTPTQKLVQWQQKSQRDTSIGDADWDSLNAMFNKLAAELEQAKKELAEIKSTFPLMNDVRTVIALRDVSKERDSLRRQIEELKKEISQNNETAQTWDRLSLESALISCRDALIKLDYTARSICGTVEERSNAHKAIKEADAVLAKSSINEQQRDTAIWNAAIEAAAKVAIGQNREVIPEAICSVMSHNNGVMSAYKVILNLKRKEKRNETKQTNTTRQNPNSCGAGWVD